MIDTLAHGALGPSGAGDGEQRFVKAERSFCVSELMVGGRRPAQQRNVRIFSPGRSSPILPVPVTQTGAWLLQCGKCWGDSEPRPLGGSLVLVSRPASRACGLHGCRALALRSFPGLMPCRPHLGILSNFSRETHSHRAPSSAACT